ncbi:MAG: hypothetical protein ABGZ31_13290, partial [Roseibacillus sp.]
MKIGFSDEDGKTPGKVVLVSVRGGRRGSTMVAVFWLISVMALYIFTAIQLLDYEDRLVSGQVEGTRASQMAEMGI